MTFLSTDYRISEIEIPHFHFLANAESGRESQTSERYLEHLAFPKVDQHTLRYLFDQRPRPLSWVHKELYRDYTPFRFSIHSTPPPFLLENHPGLTRPVLPVRRVIRIKESCSLSLKIVALAVLTTLFVIGVLGFAGVIPINTVSASTLTFTPPVIVFSALLSKKIKRSCC